MNKLTSFKIKLFNSLIAFALCLGWFSSSLRAEENSEYLVMNYWLPDVEETGFKLLLSGEIRARLKIGALNCYVKKDGLAMGFSLDGRPYLIHSAFDIRIGIRDLIKGEEIIETRHVAEGHQNISNSLKYKNGRFFLAIQNARFTRLSGFLEEMSEFPIYSSEEEVQELPDGKMGCYYWKP